LENAVEPQLGDRVLLFGLNLKALGMFNSDRPITDKGAARYNGFSCVGVLLSTFKGLASTRIRSDREGDDDILNIATEALVTALFGRSFRAIFDSISGNEELIRLVFGKLSPLEQRHLAAVDRKYGFSEDADGKEVSVPAPVTETHSVDSPLTKNIQGPLNVTVGIDNEGNSSEAPVTVRFGENSDIDLSSASGLTLYFEKAVLFETAEGFGLKLGGDASLETDGDLTIKAGGKVNIESGGLTINNVLEVK
jgi:hypothetical protein